MIFGKDGYGLNGKMVTAERLQLVAK